jgi:5-(aminomethyl)-3-furanmethanol phosphate kinase
MTPAVVKVGGSLFDLPELGPALRTWLEHHALPRVLLVPGGGPMVDVVRDYDARFRLGEEAAHWLALRAMTINAHLLAGLLGGAVVAGWGECPPIWADGRVPVLDGFAFAVADEARPDHLPHSWAVTSDSVAARAAVVGGAGRLSLLKSLSIPQGVDWSEAARRGWVDGHFPAVIARHPVVVEAVDFRALSGASRERSG